MANNAISAAAVPALCASMSAVHVLNSLNPRPGASTVAAQAPAVQSGVRDLLLVASAAGFSGSVIFMYRHLHRGARNRRLPEIAYSMLCVSAGVLLFFLFVLTPGGAGVDVDVDHGAQARALGLAALGVLPAAATVTFFLATMLIVAGHIRSGGEGGGGAVAVAGGEEPIIQAPVAVVGLVRLLRRMALASAAGLVCLMAVAVYGAAY